MKKSIAVGGGLVALIISAATAFIVVARPFDSPLVKACEEIFKMQLRSPSGYSRVDAIDSIQPITIREWVYLTRPDRLTEDPLTERQAKRMEEAGQVPAWLTTYVEYDAPNAYGTPIRGTIECKYLSKDSSPRDASRYDIVVNGKTLLEWLKG
ncbi:MAG: hypothetical protein ACOH2L_17655 [Devosia sp.]